MMAKHIILEIIFIGVLIVIIDGAMVCREQNEIDPTPFQSRRVSTKVKAMPPPTNGFMLSSVKRTHSFMSKGKTIVPPIISKRQNVAGPLIVPSSYQAAESVTNPQRIVIPIGVSNYRPVQYVDTFKNDPFPSSYIDQLMKSVTPSSTNGTSTVNSTRVAESSDINEVKVDDSPSNKHNDHATVDNFIVSPSVRRHPTRFIELESSYVPLTIRFSSRTSKLNIIPGDTNYDLVGQDSTRHDSFGRRMSSSSPSSANSDDSRRIELDSRAIFGEDRNEEPLVLKSNGSKSTNVPANMQRIIKCIFPDFRFDGEEKIQSAC